MAKKKQSGATPATTALNAAGVVFEVHSYEHDPRADSYGTEAAEAMCVDPSRVFKTLMAEVDGELVVAVVPVAGQLDLKALARAAGGRKAALAEPRAAERATGYVLGGISPLGQRTRHPTVIDTSATTYRTIYCSAGRRGLEIEVDPADLVRLTAGRLAPIRR